MVGTDPKAEAWQMCHPSHRAVATSGGMRWRDAGVCSWEHAVSPSLSLKGGVELTALAAQ